MVGAENLPTFKNTAAHGQDFGWVDGWVDLDGLMDSGDTSQGGSIPEIVHCATCLFFPKVFFPLTKFFTHFYGHF